MMPEPIAAAIVCPACGSDIEAAGARCAGCGRRLAPTAAGRRGSFTERRWFLILLMVGAALFLAFPWLWKSPAFSRGEKAFWTMLVLLETAALFGLCGWVIWWSWQRIAAAW